MSEEKIKVTIKCKRIMHYDQEIEMSKQDYEKVKEVDCVDISERRHQEIFNVIDSYLDHWNIISSDDEFRDAEIVKSI